MGEALAALVGARAGGESNLKHCIRAYAAYYEKRDISLIPVFSSLQQFMVISSKGGGPGYQAVLRHIPVASDELEWAQIRDIRSDEESVKKLRSLRAWVSSTLQAKSMSQAEDIISQRVDDYSWAMKKHGIKAVTGSVSNILSIPSVSSSAVSAAGVAAMTQSPILAALAGGLVLATKAAVNIVDITRGAIKATSAAAGCLGFQAFS